MMKTASISPYTYRANNLFSPVLHLLLGAAIATCTLNAWAQQDRGNCNSLIDKSTMVPKGVSCSYGNRNRLAIITQSQPILVLKKIEDLSNPMSDALKQENQMGLVEPGTRIRIVGETITSNFMLNYTKIEILQGRLKGRTGWVSTNAIVMR